MSKTVIQFMLTAREINRAIKEVEKYKRELELKTERLQERLAEKIASLVQSGFNGAVVDDLISGGVKTAQVNVAVDTQGTTTLVIANGEDAVWVEFGAGVFHNGSSGASPHPKGGELGFTIGGYGKGMGKRDTWGYYDGDTLHLTHGTPAVMPMYNSVVAVCAEIVDMAREVFG